MNTRRSFLRGISAAASAAIVGAATPAWARALADDAKRMQRRKLWVSPGLSSSVRTADIAEIRIGDTVLLTRGSDVVEWRYEAKRSPKVLESGVINASWTAEVTCEIDPQSWVAFTDGMEL